MKLGALVALFVFIALPARAQAANVILTTPATAKLEFTSPSHAAVVPVGQVNAGQQVVTSYQGMVFLVGASGSAVITGPVIAKTLAVTGTVAPFRLTFAQLGITNIPPCTVVAPAACPQYFVLLAAIGPGGTTNSVFVPGIDDSFALAPLQPSQPAVAPSATKVLP